MSLRISTSEPSTGEQLRPSGAAAPVEQAAMRAALRLARRGIGTTHPNPRVGAIVLDRGEPVGEGWHRRAGLAHAEIVALDRARARARGATLVVTLEPCAHHGRTPPCTDAILASGIRRVVVGVRDPNPIVDGRGLEALRAAGVDVVLGVEESACLALNAPYRKFLATGLPWVLLKSMLSLDGRVAAPSGESRGLGGEDELRRAHRLRAESDAVLIGIGTALADDPMLTVRAARGRSPMRVVFDSSLRLPLDSRLVRSAGEAPLVVATVSCDEARSRAFVERGVSVWSFEADRAGQVSPRAVLERLAREGSYSVLVEGGPGMHTSFLREGLVDRVALGIAPFIVGGRSGTTWTGDLGTATLAEAIGARSMSVRRLGRDLWIEADVSQEGDSRV